MTTKMKSVVYTKNENDVIIYSPVGPCIYIEHIKYGEWKLSRACLARKNKPHWLLCIKQACMSIWCVQTNVCLWLKANIKSVH